MKDSAETVTADDMAFEADERTSESDTEARTTREGEWVDFLKHAEGRYEWDLPSEDYYTGRVFQSVIGHLERRTQDIEKGYFSPVEFSIRDSLAAVLAFDFHYTYTFYTWDGTTLDRNDAAAFLDQKEWGTLDANKLKKAVCRALRDFLLAGAVCARKIGSAAYEEWAKALVLFDYQYKTFDDGSKIEDIKVYLQSIKAAARRTCIDYAVFAVIAGSENQKHTLHTYPPPKGKKRGKTPSKRG